MATFRWLSSVSLCATVGAASNRSGIKSARNQGAHAFSIPQIYLRATRMELIYMAFTLIYLLLTVVGAHAPHL
jgi:hypothetical protein